MLSPPLSTIPWKPDDLLLEIMDGEQRDVTRGVYAMQEIVIEFGCNIRGQIRTLRDLGVEELCEKLQSFSLLGTFNNGNCQF